MLAAIFEAAGRPLIIDRAPDPNEVVVWIGSCDTTPIITDAVSLDEFPDMFANLGRPTTRSKVLLEPFN